MLICFNDNMYGKFSLPADRLIRLTDSKIKQSHFFILNRRWNMTRTTPDGYRAVTPSFTFKDSQKASDF